MPTHDKQSRLHENTFEKQLTQLHSPMQAFAKQLTGSHADADDLVQMTMVKALNGQDNFKRGTNLRAWVMSILRNSYYAQRRKKKELSMDPEEVVRFADSEKASPPIAMEPGEDKFDLVLKCLSTIAEADCDALILRNYSGLKCKQIAAELGRQHEDVVTGIAKTRDLVATKILDEDFGDVDLESWLEQKVESATVFQRHLLAATYEKILSMHQRALEARN